MKLSDDVFSSYERGIEKLFSRIETTRHAYVEALTLRSRMEENIGASRRYGDTEMRRSERAQITESLNRLAMQELGASFSELCQAQRSKLPLSERSDTSTVRELLIVAFSDDEVSALCYDYFRPVYDDFASGMGKAQKVQRLVEHCERQGQVDALLDLVQHLNPAQYGRYEQRLR